MVCSICEHVQRMLKMRRHLYTGGKFKQTVRESQSKIAVLINDHNWMGQCNDTCTRGVQNVMKTAQYISKCYITHFIITFIKRYVSWLNKCKIAVVQLLI